MSVKTPYPGLRSFQKHEADIFFGRGEQLDQMLHILQTNRFLAVVGASGCGKSSLVRAGLLPALERGLLAGVDGPWHFIVLRPGGDPFSRLAQALHCTDPANAAAPESIARTQATLASSDLGLVQALADLGVPADGHVLLFVDQFEEIGRFRKRAEAAPDHDAAARLAQGNTAAAFVNLLLKTATQAERIIHVVLTMRAGFLGECDAFAGLAEVINASQFLVPRLTREHLRRAILDPLKVVGGDAETALVEHVLDDIGCDPDPLPLMQHCLRRLWSAACAQADGANVLRLQDYLDPRIGGLERALSNHADEAYKTLTAPQQRIAQKMFCCLCEKDYHGDWTCRPMKVDEIAGLVGVHCDEVCPVVEAFIRDARNFLVTSPEGALTTETMVEISHDALIRQWNRMEVWLRKEQESAQQYRRLLDRARRWKAGTVGLWGAGDLDAALRWREAERPSAAWADRHGGDLALTQEFLQASSALQAQQLRKQAEHDAHLRRRAWRFGLAALVSLVLFLYAWLQQFMLSMNERELKANELAAVRQAEESKTLAFEAKESEALAMKIARAAKHNLALARFEIASREIAAGNIASGFFDYWRAFHDAPTDNPLRQSTRNLLAAWGACLGIPFLHDGPVRCVAFRPDGGALVTAGNDGMAQLWHAETGKPIGAPMRHEGSIDVAAFSPDSKTLLTAGRDRVARLWNAADGTPIAKPLAHEDGVRAAAFSPDSKTILTGSADGKTRLWDRATGAPIGELVGHKDCVRAVAFGADGLTILTGSDDCTAQLWDCQSRAPLRMPIQHQQAVVSVAFSPDGNTFVTASSDGTAQIRACNTGLCIGEPLQHDGAVRAVAFSPDSKTMFTGGADHTARLWNAQTGKAIGKPLSHRGPVQAVAFHPLGLSVLTGGADKTARLWDIATGKQIGASFRHRDEIRALAYSRDGRSILTGSKDGTARLWTTNVGTAFGTPEQRQRDVIALAFSPDGRTALSASRDCTALLWNAYSGKRLAEPLRHRGPIKAIAFSPDGRTVLTAGADRAARVWNSKTGKLVCEMPGHHGAVETAAFSPDSLHVLTGGADGFVRLWDAETGAAVGVPLSHGRDVLSAVFSPDGRTILTGCADKTARLWQVKNGVPIGAPLPHEAEVLTVAFSPTGDYFLTGSADGKTRVWETASQKMTGLLQHKDAVVALAYSRSSEFIASAGKDGVVWLASGPRGRPLVKPLKHLDAVQSVAFSPDGSTILTGSLDRTAQLWDVRTSTRLGEPFRHLAPVEAAAFRPDGQAVLTGGQDGKVVAWRVIPMASAEPERLRRSVEVRTGFQLDAQGIRQNLARLPWLSLRERLVRFQDVRAWQDLPERDKMPFRRVPPMP